MSAHHIAIERIGLITSVGLTAPESCAALRAKISNPTETRFIDSSGAWIMAHQVQLAQPWRGLIKLAKMAAMAIDEALQDVPKKEWSALPLLLCVAETERPGRIDGLDDKLFLLIQQELGVTFAPQSAVVAQGRVGVAVALAQARASIADATSKRVLIAATDSFLTWPTLSYYERHDRLLMARNSNGFMPGEGAGALLIRSPQGRPGEWVCTGIGFGREAAHLDSGDPLRADGLTQAIKAGMNEAGSPKHGVDFRITDNSGEHYYFKEASLALSRTVRYQKEFMDHWHPAESIGETGATSGVVCAALGQVAAAKHYAPGGCAIQHFSNDAGQRAAFVSRAG